MNIKILLSCIFVFCLLQESHAQRAVTYTTTADRTKSLEKTVSATTTAAGSSNVITLNPGETNQSIEGFGYAITYAAAYNLLVKMSKPQRTALLKKTFSPASGYGANYVRVSIGCCDFSSRDYTLCDEKGSDSDPLAKFALQSDETDYVIPVLKEILAINPDLKIMAAPWTCPRWMKVDNITDKNAHNQWRGGSLNPAYYKTYADYFVRFINAMKANGINITAVTPQNEPLNKGNCASLYMPWQEEAPFVKELAAAFKQNGITTKIYLFDHNYNYDNISDQDDYPVKVYDEIGTGFEGAELVVGAAYHNYGGNYSELSDIHWQKPDKDLIFTEHTIGDWIDGSNLSTRLVYDMKDLVIGTVNNWCKAVIVWNFMLDENRGPYTNEDGACKTAFGAVDIFNDGSLRYNSHYYAVSHISAVVKPGACRINTTGWWAENMDYSAFRNPDGTLAIIFASSNSAEQNFCVTDGKEYASVRVPANSVVSVLFGDVEEQPAGMTEGQEYDLIQNKSYILSDALVYGSIDSDCFFRNLDNSDTYRFLGTDGKYRIVIDNGMLTAVAADTEVYVGGWTNTFNKSGLASSGTWQDPKPSLAKVAPGTYRMTLTTGVNINAKDLNIKFYPKEDYSKEYKAADIALTGLAADKLDFEMSGGNRTGNLKYKSGASLEDNTTYIFTVTPNADNSAYSLDIQKYYDVSDANALNNAISSKAEYFRFKGNVTQNMLKSLTDYRAGGGKIRYMDFTEATLSKLPADFTKACETLEMVLLPNGLKQIGNYAFSSCPNLRVVNLTGDLETLGIGMLMYDYRLHALSFDNRQEKAKVTVPMDFIRMYKNEEPYKTEYEKSSKEGLKDFYIGDNWEIDSIGRQAFYKNHNLESFKYSDNGTTIGDIRSNAFTETYSLPAADINNMIKNSGEIWNAAFYSCHQLDKLVIPESVTMIDNAAFGDCRITDIYVSNPTSPAVPLYDSSWYDYSWNYFSEYAFAGIRNKTNGTDTHIRQNAMTVHFGEGVSAEQYRYSTEDGNDDTRIDENGNDDEAKGKAKYGEFLRLLTKSVYQDHDYDIAGQEHADLRIYRTFKNNWNTVCLPVTLTGQQVKKTFGSGTVVAEFTGVSRASDGNVLRFKVTDEGIKAGKPYIMMLKDDYGNNAVCGAPYSEETYNGSYYDEYVTDDEDGYYLAEDVSAPSRDNLPDLQRVTYDAYTFVGNYNSTNISADNKVLYISDNTFRYRNKGEVTNAKGYRAYFIIDESVNESGLSKSVNFTFDEATGVVLCRQDADEASLPVYDLTGRMVGKNIHDLPTGIYIKGGRKYVVR